ncbi:hypothetical protein ACRAWD_22430 [Caulobacter segnis]
MTWVLSYTHINDGAGFGFPTAFDPSGAWRRPAGPTTQSPTCLMTSWASCGQTGPAIPGTGWTPRSSTNTCLTMTGICRSLAEHNEANYENKYVWVGAFNTLPTDKTQSTTSHLCYDTERDHQWAGEGQPIRRRRSVRSEADFLLWRRLH